MGTDIHMIVERKINNKWGILKSCWYDGYSKKKKTMVDLDRNYDLFAILADVRNGCGFAGSDTGDGFVPISKPKGLPENNVYDNDLEYENPEYIWLGDHSHSWLLLTEILDYDWKQLTHKRGYIEEKQYKNYKGGYPETWCAGGWGKDTMYITEKEYKALKFGNKIEKGIDYRIQVEWVVSYREVMQKKWFRFIEILKKIDNPENIRLVFGFDN